MNSSNANNNEVNDFYLTDPESYVDPDWTTRDSLTEPDPTVSILSKDSCFVENYEITFTSYEDIKRELDHYIGGHVVSQESPNLYIAKGRLNAYIITTFPDESSKFLVSAFTYNKVRWGCSFWNYVEHEFDMLCEYLDRMYDVKIQDRNLEDVEFIVPANHLLAYTEIVNNFTSREVVKDALKYAINCSHNQHTSDDHASEDEPLITKEIPDSCILIKPFINEPSKFKIYLYQPKNDYYISQSFNSSNLIYYLEDYRDRYQSTKEEGEAYYEKQFEDYLRLNPVSDDDASEEGDDDDECPPLGIATAENAARANEILSAYKNNDDIDTWVDKYIQENRIRSSEGNNLNVDEDIYVYDGIDIYE